MSSTYNHEDHGMDNGEYERMETDELRQQGHHNYRVEHLGHIIYRSCNSTYFPGKSNVKIEYDITKDKKDTNGTKDTKGAKNKEGMKNMK